MPSALQKPRVSIIMVSHNTRSYILAALKAVFASKTTVSFEVIVVENASTDGSFEAIRKQFPRVILHETKALIGFSDANMIGVRRAKGDQLFFLNPDTEVSLNTLEVLSSQLENGFDAVTCQLRNTDGSIQPQGGSLPTLWNLFLWASFLDDIPGVSRLLGSYQQRDRSAFLVDRRVRGWVGGTAVMIKTTVIEGVGGWDVRIKLYGEDVELCYRLQKAGKKIGYTAKTSIIHHQNKSTGGSARAIVGEVEGLIYLWRKWKPRYQVPALKLILIIGAWLRVLVFGILLGDDKRKGAYLEASRRVFLAR